MQRKQQSRKETSNTRDSFQVEVPAKINIVTSRIVAKTYLHYLVFNKISSCMYLFVSGIKSTLARLSVFYVIFALTLTRLAKIGRIRVVVAELLVTSVSIAMMSVRRRFMAHGGILLNTSNCSPIKADSPDFCKLIDMRCNISH